MSEPIQSRPEMWSSSWMFILAASGSAIGLGNIWKFPYITGENGGGAFVLVYLICILIVGLPVMIGEIVLGKLGRASPINALVKLGRRYQRPTSWSVIGYMGVFSGFLILSFYAVVAGWICHYILLSAMGEFTAKSSGEVSSVFGSFLANPWEVTFWFTLFMAVTIYFVARGVNRGLELCIRYAMPAVLVLLLILLGYGIHAGGFGASFSFLFSLDFSQLKPAGVLIALGHAFFTLSLGMGAIMIYGAYVPEEVSVRKTALTITVLDTVIALLAGLAIFSIVFANGLEPAAGPSLIFETVPLAFGSLPLGSFFGTLFFLLVALAALTSAISLTEPVISYCRERYGWTRIKTALTVGGICWVLGMGSVLSMNVWQDFKPLVGFTDSEGFLFVTIFDGFDQWTQLVLLPLGGLLIALYVAWIMPWAVIRDALGLKEGIRQLWLLVVGFLTPIAVLAVLLTPFLVHYFSS